MKLIARDAQIQQLVASLKEALQGRFQVVFVTGEAGIGKTTLITHLIEGIKPKRPDIFVATSRCYSIAGSQQDAYLPFMQILEQLVGAKKGDTLWDRVRSGLAEVAPEWIEVVPVIGDVAAATIRTVQWAQREFSSQGSGSDTSRLMIQYTNALKLVSATAPLLLWIDDLHWSDNATLDLMSFLADHARDSRIMLVASYRPTDITREVHGQPHPVRRLVSRLGRYNGCDQLPLTSFTHADLEQFLKSRRYNFPTEFVDRLRRQSGGNPLFVQEYVTLLHNRGLVREEQGAFVLTQAAVEVAIPDTVQAVIGERLDLIGQDLQRLLSYASVQGERFASRVLAQLLQANEIDVLDRLNLLDRVHQLIRELEESHLIIKVGSEYQFIHALIQQTLYNNLSAAQRRHLHLAIAQLLESLYGDDAPQYASDLAIHFECGGDLPKAIPYYLQAGRAALAILAPDNALLYAEKVRHLATKLPDKAQSTVWQLDALIQVAEARYWKAEYDAALAACGEGDSFCVRGDFPEQHAYLFYWRAMIADLEGRFGDIISFVRQALSILAVDSRDPHLQGLLYAQLVGIGSRLTLTEMKQASETALAIARRHNFPDVQARTLMRKAWTMLAWVDNVEEGLQAAREGLCIAQLHNMAYEQAYCHRMISRACLRLKQGENALHHAEQAVMITRNHGLQSELHVALRFKAMAYRDVVGNWHDSLNFLREAIDIAKQYKFPVHRDVIGEIVKTTIFLGYWQEAEDAQREMCELIDPRHPRSWGLFYGRQGRSHYVQGLFEQSIQFFEQALKIFDTHSPGERDKREFQPYLGLALIEVGKIQQAMEHCEQARSYWQSRNIPMFAQSLQGLARCAMQQGDINRAIDLLREALNAAGGSYNPDNGWPVWQHVSVDLGKALLTAGNPEEALQYAITGYGRFKQAKLVLFGEAAFVVGQILVAQGKREEALAYLHEAHSDWQRLELTHHLPAWEAFMQEHGLETAFG